MVLSALKRLGKTASAIAAAAAIGLSAFATGPALAQEDAADWYIFVGRNANDNPIVVYFQSNTATPDFEPTGSIAFVLNTEYTVEGDFDPTQACRWQSLDNADLDYARELRTKIIYGPNSEQDRISFIDLPIYMAQQTALSLLQEGVLIDERATVPYFNCAGFVWAQVLAQPPEVWEELIAEGAVTPQE